MHLKRTGTYDYNTIVDLTQLKKDLRVEHDADDVLIESIRASAVEWIEQQFGVAIMQSTWTVKLETFKTNETLYMALSDVQSITDVKYFDTEEAEQTMVSTKYSFAENAQCFQFEFYDSFDLSETKKTPITITLTAGPSTPHIPLKNAIRMLVGSMYENRQDEITGTIVSKFENASEKLIQPYRPLTA